MIAKVWHVEALNRRPLSHFPRHVPLEKGKCLERGGWVPERGGEGPKGCIFPRKRGKGPCQLVNSWGFGGKKVGGTLPAPEEWQGEFR